ncbi:kelch protein 12 [Biomphalaria glabrata]|nr:kelch protein 12 [Biomphalaria glabrata]
MAMERNVGNSIIKGFKDFWRSEELQDFTVKIGSSRFRCHRLLLAACSEFFRCLFRSGMKETELKCATLQEISSETFELILKTLYTGYCVLTSDTVIDVWRAAHQLQIQFLITECEGFAKETLCTTNYIEYYTIAKLFDSKEVLEIVWPLILKNAHSFLQTEFFNSEMDVSDVLKLIQNQDLKITSEDDVVHAILKWVECKPCEEEDSDKKHSGRKSIKTGHNSLKTSVKQPNKDMTVSLNDNRKKHLPELLSNTRTCLLSMKCLEMLSSHPLVRETKEATDIIFDSLLYQSQVGKRNGQWPPRAIYRNTGNYINAAIAIRSNINEIKLKAFSFSSKEWLQLPDLLSRSRVTFVAIDKSFYALGDSTTNNPFPFIRSDKLLELTNGVWSEKCISIKLPPEHFVLAVDAFVYIFVPSNQEVWQLDPVTGRLIRKTDLPCRGIIQHVTNHEQFILVFYKTTNQNQAGVCYFDTSQNTWKGPVILNGSAQGMISFKNSNSTYLMQTNGNLWMVQSVESQSQDIKFKYWAKLWNCDWTLHGAVIFRDELYVYGVRSEALKQDVQKQCSLSGIFNQIVYMESEDTVPSTFIPLTLSRQCLLRL